jgi:hypothetical protein
VEGVGLLFHRTLRASRVRAEIKVPSGTEELFPPGLLFAGYGLERGRRRPVGIRAQVQTTLPHTRSASALRRHQQDEHE